MPLTTCPSHLLLSLFPYLTGKEASALLVALPRNHLSASERQVATCRAVASERRALYGRHCLTRGAKVPIPLRPQLTDLLLDTFMTPGKNNRSSHSIAIAYCSRNSNMDKLAALLYSGASFQHNREQTRKLLSSHLEGCAELHDEDMELLQWRTRIIRYVNREFDWRFSVFHTANLDEASEGDRQTRRQLLICLLEHGADLRFEPNDAERTPLLAAVSSTWSGRAHGDIVDILLEHGANPNASCAVNGMTPLHMAAARAHLNLVHELCAMGGRPDAVNSISGLTPIHHAANSDRSAAVAVVNVLVANGADVNACDNDSCTAMHFAATKGNVSMVTALINAGAVITAPETGLSALMFATARGHEQVVRVLLARGASANESGNCGKQPLHVAIETRNHAIVDLLIDNGADINAVDRGGSSPLAYAISKDCMRTMMRLLEAGANAGNFSLHLAARLNREHVIQLLLVYGADRNERDATGKTALHYAARFGHASLTKSLLDSGFNVDVLDQKRHSALYFAQEHGHIQVRRVLLEAGALTDAHRVGRKPAAHNKPERKQFWSLPWATSRSRRKNVTEGNSATDAITIASRM